MQLGFGRPVSIAITPALTSFHPSWNHPRESWGHDDREDHDGPADRDLIVRVQP